MNKIKSIGVLCLACGLLFSSSLQKVNQGEDSFITRNIEVENSRFLSMYEDEFIDTNLTNNENEVQFLGTSIYDKSLNKVIDTVGFDDYNKDDLKISYDCKFDMNKLQYILTINVIDNDGKILESETQYTDAFVRENGHLDAFIELDGSPYLLSDLIQNYGIDNCFWGWLIAIVVVAVIAVYAIVAGTAEQVKSKQNYKYNKELEEIGSGVNEGVYVTDQHERILGGHKCGCYKFGFTYFESVGCEVASAYNLMIASNKTERLSETIRDFETMEIEYAIGWGHLGSDPKQMYRYFKSKNLDYHRYTTFNDLKDAVSLEYNCKIIMSRWNADISTGLHTFFIEKNSMNYEPFQGYNFDRDRYLENALSSIESYNNGSGFVVGYLL